MNYVLALPDLALAARDWRRDGATVVLAHGCFDLLHIGHIQHLQAARALGTVLVVTVTADAHVDKGPGRPRFPDALRAEAVAALSCVDAVAVCPHPTAAEAIALLRPHVFVKGAEYRACRTAKINAEGAALAAVGGRLEFVSGPVTCSSTRLLAEAVARA